MKAVIEDAGTCRKKIKVEWPADKVQADYRNVLAEYSKVARVKGFRPGKAPVKVVEKQYARSIIKDLRDRLIPEGYQQAVKEHKLEVLQVLDLEEPDITVGEPCHLSITVEVAPDFTLPEYKGVPLTRKVEPVTDEQVDETINRFQQQFATFEEVSDRPVGRGDLVQVDYEGVADGQPIDDISANTKGLGKREDFWVQADDNAFLPEFADGLVGAKVGEKKQIQVDFSDDFAAEELRGKQATYFVDIKNIREKKLPELDAAFFEKLGIKDEAELRERIRSDLQAGAESRETGRLRNAVVDHIANQIEMDLPPSRTARETQQMVEQIVRDQQSRGAQENMLVEHKDEIMQTATRGAEQRVKAQFVLDQIAAKEAIEPTPAQIRTHIDQLAARYAMPPDKLRAELKKNEALDNVVAELRRSLVIDFLLEQAQISETSNAGKKEK